MSGRTIMSVWGEKVINTGLLMSCCAVFCSWCISRWCPIWTPSKLPMVMTIGSVLVTVVSYSMFVLRCFPCRSGLYLALSFFGIYYHSYPWGAIYFLLALTSRQVAQ